MIPAADVCSFMYTGSDVRLGGEQTSERRVPAVSVRQIGRRVGQVSALGRQTQCLLKQRSMAHSDSSTIVS